MITPDYINYYDDWSAAKYITITIYNTDNTVYAQIRNSNIKAESLLLSQSICDGDNIEFVGCIPSRFEIVFFDSLGIASDLKDKYITVNITVMNGDNPYTTPIFDGYVDDCAAQTTEGFFKLIAFDILYKWSQLSLTDWYNTLTDRMTVKQFRDALFTQLSYTQSTTTLSNDSVEIKPFLTEITALDLIKSVCQINGVFGRVKRTAANSSPEFEYFKLVNPSSKSIGKVIQKLQMSNYSTVAINRVIVNRTSNDQTPGTATSTGATDINAYIIQGNVLLRLSNQTTRDIIAQNLLAQIVQAPVYIPFKCDTIGYPPLECGDKISLLYGNNTYNLLVLSRTLKGIQAIKDSFSASGEQYQPNIVSDLGQQISDLIYAQQESSESISVIEPQVQQAEQKINKVEQAVKQSVTVNESLVESITTNLTGTALTPRITHRPDGWEWQDYIVDPTTQEVTYTPKWSTSNTSTQHNYINVANNKIKFLSEELSAPSNYSQIDESEVEYLTSNGKQLYFTDLSTLNAFTTINPQILDSTITAHVLEMYKCRKLKVVSSAVWNIEMYQNITVTQGQTPTINKVLGIKFDSIAAVEYNSTTKSLKAGITNATTGRETATVIKDDGNGEYKFYKRINNTDYEDFIFAKYATEQQAIADTNLPDGNFIVLTGS